MNGTLKGPKKYYQLNFIKYINLYIYKYTFYTETVGRSNTARKALLADY